MCLSKCAFLRMMRRIPRIGEHNLRVVFSICADRDCLMVSLLRQSDFRSVQNLLFCYLCGRDFVAGDSKNHDHVPPECIFSRLDREPLLLPAHTACNSSYHLLDEKIGQLIALRYGRVPRNPAHRRLQYVQI